MMAAQAILDRGYGKPTQSIDANITSRPHNLRRFATQSAADYGRFLAFLGNKKSGLNFRRRLARTE